MKMRLCVIALAVLLSGISLSEAGTIKVLILDDVFQDVPAKDERLEQMGRIQGDLLVNGTHYVGNIAVWKGATSMYIVNELPLEDYVKNVVTSEVGTSWEMEALKAQAVISRTYALYHKRFNQKATYDLTSSVMHQVYKGNPVDARVTYAVMNTEGEVLMHEGELIEALYHSTCGGMTEDAEEVFGRNYPYMKPVQTSCRLSPYAIWERRIPVDDIEKTLNTPGIKEIKTDTLTSTGRVKTLTLVHAKGSTTIKATDLRKALGWKRLPSTNFSLTGENGSIVFEGRGYGHGVGLCQWSALEMAREGKNYKEILAFFYPGATIRIYEDR